jgi:acetolactate synthase I/II/III large subunit
MERTGAQIVWETILREGVDIVFGYPGGAILPTYDAMPAYPVRHVLVRHEQAAVHMAEGWARATGKVGVCMATSGPGATNLVTGLANAMMDSIPIVAITGQVASNLLGGDAFQETDVTGVTLPVTKYNYLDHRYQRPARGHGGSVLSSPAAAARARSWWTSARTCRTPRSTGPIRRS